MQHAVRAVHAQLTMAARAHPSLVARLRLFGLLALLLPLFAGLEHLVQDGVPRVEIRFVSEDVPVVVPVERIVERVVERVVYVPVPEPAEEAGAPPAEERPADRAEDRTGSPPATP